MIASLFTLDLGIHVHINTHALGLNWTLAPSPCFPAHPQVLPQGRRPKQPHAYGTVTHKLSMCPQESAWAKMQQASQDFAYIYECAHNGHGSKWGQTRIYVFILSVLLCSFRPIYKIYMTKSNVPQLLVPAFRCSWTTLKCFAKLTHLKIVYFLFTNTALSLCIL